MASASRCHCPEAVLETLTSEVWELEKPNRLQTSKELVFQIRPICRIKQDSVSHLREKKFSVTSTFNSLDETTYTGKRNFLSLISNLKCTTLSHTENIWLPPGSVKYHKITYHKITYHKWWSETKWKSENAICPGPHSPPSPIITLKVQPLYYELASTICRGPMSTFWETTLAGHPERPHHTHN